MAADLTNFAYSFSNAVITVGGRQFIGIKNVEANQELTDSAIYGTDARPIGRSVGQVQMGRGSLTFSDFGEGVDFYTSLGAQPFMSIWDLDYDLVRADGEVQSIVVGSCRLTGVGIQHEAGPDAVEISYPFSFLRYKMQGIDSILDPKRAINAAIDIAQNLFL